MTLSSVRIIGHPMESHSVISRYSSTLTWFSQICWCETSERGPMVYLSLVSSVKIFSVARRSVLDARAQ